MIIISISKIKKITAIKKKWIENGNRFIDIGLNPHSNGDDFCLSIIDLFPIIEISIISVVLIMAINIKNVIIRFIIYFFMNFKVGGFIYFLY